MGGLPTFPYLATNYFNNRIMNLRQLSTEIHAGNVAKGFYDKPFPVGRALWLIVSELAEATDAERAGKYASRDDFENDPDYKFKRELFAGKTNSSSVDIAFKQAFALHIKDTFEDEIGDAAIRTLDVIGSLKNEGEIRFYPYSELIGHTREIMNINEQDNSFFFLQLSEYISHVSSDIEVMKYGLSILFSILHFRAVKFWHFDLFWHIDQKIKYNALRPYKHGKEF